MFISLKSRICASFSFSISTCTFLDRTMIGCFVLLIVLIADSLGAVSAYPTSAGSCIGGEAAVGGSHIVFTFMDQPRTFGLISGSLADGDVEVTIGDIPLVDPLTSYELSTGVEYVISVVGTLYDGYKGLLIRMEDPTERLDLSAALLPDENTQEAAVCQAPVVGITHVDSEFKRESTGRIRVDEPGSVVLDITMVGLNDAFATFYGYNRFMLTFVPREISESIASPVAFQNPTTVPSYSQSDSLRPVQALSTIGPQTSTHSTVPGPSPPKESSDNPEKPSTNQASLVVSPELASSFEPSIHHTEGEQNQFSGDPTDVPIDNVLEMPIPQGSTPTTFLSASSSDIPSDVPSLSPSDTPSFALSDVPSTFPSTSSSSFPSDIPSGLVANR